MTRSSPSIDVLQVESERTSDALRNGASKAVASEDREQETHRELRSAKLLRRKAELKAKTSPYVIRFFALAMLRNLDIIQLFRCQF